MSMSNFIERAGVAVPVMAASNHTPRDVDSADEIPETNVGIDHLTVVPTNFEPPDDGREK
ncbi:hypothetical protein AArcMg_2098 [Natrarchaeobaculum sulfurireducens]|uniref:Uncharacterized protein n=1 Tax=Natrarchaeobaculum sulfurireducens TaxID=2044521 RepID=A0A346PRF1_9EURY|nr:hypothetical protein AArc1_1579 [Natrarchaeobaculum sulfurireducens]AXR82096.1 hypothetical protein AArcMg_2098 [Natrarchaeobaculum sulfurireducens]